MSIDSQRVSPKAPDVEQLTARPFDGELDMTPPPDHEGWLELRANGLRETRKGWETRRRLRSRS